MTKFLDANGREWSLAVNVGAVKRVREACDVDLASQDPTDVDKLCSDPVLLVDTLWVLCEKQASDRSVTQEDFGESLVGDPIDMATGALIEAVTDFFPGQTRTLLRAAHSKSATLRKKAEALALAQLENPELEAKVLAAMTEKIETDISAALTRLSSPTK